MHALLLLAVLGADYPVAETYPVPIYVHATAPAAHPAPAKGYYPSHSGGHWSVRGDHSPSREAVIEHLLNDPNHKGKFDPAWVRSLSRESALALHDDDHTHTVNFATSAPPKPKVVRSGGLMGVIFGNPTTCPGGNCPVQGRRR